MSKKEATIYHNPKCGTSRKALQLLEDKGYTLNIIKYLEAGLTEQDILDLMSRLENKELILRKKEPDYKELQPKPATDEEIAKAIAANPRIMDRPIVLINGTGVVGRPHDFFQSWLEETERK